MVFDASGVESHEVFGVLFDGGAYDVGLAFDDGFAPADDAVVGLDAHKEPARRHEECFDACDLHDAPSVTKSYYRTI